MKCYRFIYIYTYLELVLWMIDSWTIHSDLCFCSPVLRVTEAETSRMPSAKILKSTQYIELGSYQYWPVLVPRGIRLYTYEQVPGFLKENPYITDGYRAYLTSKLCIKRWSQDTVRNQVENKASTLMSQIFISGAFITYTTCSYNQSLWLHNKVCLQAMWVITFRGLRWTWPDLNGIFRSLVWCFSALGVSRSTLPDS